MAKYLVIVESPAKAKTIKKFLGSNYMVTASNGHVRDLPKSRLGVDVDNDFEPHYITIRGKGELLAQLKSEAKKADKVYLATDPDREGEAISWHLAYALGLPESQIHRVTFNEITKTTVKAAIKKPRKIDRDLVDAQQARRVLDRLVGYEISPILWKKVKRGLSAGRVQAAALELLCNREDAITDFVPKEFWTIEGAFTDGKGMALEAKLTRFQGQKVEIENQEQASEHLDRIKGIASFAVESVKNGQRVRKAPDPFTTSTLQQDASRRLNFSPAKTMRLAQQLYEGIEVKGRGLTGLISYLRTDSTRIAEEMQQAAKEYISSQYGDPYTRTGSVKTKKQTVRIQDAHEAIRPTDVTLDPKMLEESLSRDQYRLYKLIYERFLASQMADAVYETQHVTIGAGDYTFDASGSRLGFAGFMKVYKEEDEQETDEEKISPAKVGQTLSLDRIQKLQHFTQPPARFTEGLLVKALEENGVGRPSTYAPTIQTLAARNYVTKEKKVLYVTELGNIVHGIIRQYFASINDLHFTAQMESELDDVENGKENWKEVIRQFYDSFEPQVEKAMEELEKVKIEDESTDVICDKCGRHMVLKIGKYGKFYACPGFPECRNTKPYFEKIGVTCPKCGGQILIKKTKKGRIYYGCENYPDCDFMSWDRPSQRECPKCGQRLYEKRGKQRKLVCLNPGCGYVLPIEDEKQPEADALQ